MVEILSVIVEALVMIAMPSIVSLIIPKPLASCAWVLMSLFWILIFIAIPLMDNTFNAYVGASGLLGGIGTYFAMRGISKWKSRAKA